MGLGGTTTTFQCPYLPPSLRISGSLLVFDKLVANSCVDDTGVGYQFLVVQGILPNREGEREVLVGRDLAAIWSSASSCS